MAEGKQEGYQYPPCPYCGEELHLDPDARAKCKGCGQWVYPNRTTFLFDHDPVTEEEREVARAIKGAIRNFAVSRDDVARIREELEDQYGHEPPSGDVLWRCWNELLTTQPDREPEIRLEMARQRYREGEDPSEHLSRVREVVKRRGEDQRATLRQVARFKAKIGLDPSPDMKLHHKFQLEEWREMGSETVEIHAQGNGCTSCQDLHGREMSINKAPKLMPLPNPSCTYTPEEGDQPLCRCSYTPGAFHQTIEVNASTQSSEGCLVALLTLPTTLLAEILRRITGQ